MLRALARDIDLDEDIDGAEVLAARAADDALRAGHRQRRADAAAVLRDASSRGVRVRLILQGEPDMPIAGLAARSLYRYLLGAGIEIHEYCERPLHGKVALADDDWATVGSSNLDPWSLSLNLEANLIIEDRGFNRALRDKLQPLMRDSCRRLRVEDTADRKSVV